MAEMGTPVTEVSLDLKLFTARTVAGFLQEATATAGGDGRVAKLEESVRSLEEEKKKIEAFKRELPLCMRLVTDVIEGLEKELEQRRGKRCLRMLGQLIPVKRNFEGERNEKLGQSCSDKTSWMSSAQLWSNNIGRINHSDNKIVKSVIEEGFEELNTPKKGKMLLESKSLTGGGAFMPFKGMSTVAENPKGEEKSAVGFPDLSMQAPTFDNGALTLSSTAEGLLATDSVSRGDGRSPASPSAKAVDRSTLQAPRKVRRCWSPELHRRFLFSLQQLGGTHVATPRQIRELMKVDGLTNDEVKSHLQKYRLHAKKMPNSPDSVNRNNEPVGVARVPEECPHPKSSQLTFSQSGSPQSPLQLARSNIAMSITADGSSEEYDGKSESCSWK